jgi:hypothetical protein
MKARLLLLTLCCGLLLAAQIPNDGTGGVTDEFAKIPLQNTELTSEQADQLVAPIALYPDSLVAQVLAGSTYPEQIVEAARWMREHPGLKRAELGNQIEGQAWDPSVKALTQFPSVLANMDRNLSWTSSLGDAWTNHESLGTTTIQKMRRRAQDAGNLKSTPEQTVGASGTTITIQPAAPDVVYVPQFDPWLAYGAPLGVWPGWSWYPGLIPVGPGVVFGAGFGIGLYSGFGWGWGNWGFDWGRSGVLFRREHYLGRGPAFFNHREFPGAGHPVFHAFPHAGGFGSSGPPHAFGGFGHGGISGGFSGWGRRSFGGGAFGGGFHGGGFHGGGRR